MTKFYQASYPLTSGDYDEYTTDAIAVLTGPEDWRHPSECERAEFRPGQRFEAAAWLASRGCPLPKAREIVETAVECRRGEIHYED